MKKLLLALVMGGTMSFGTAASAVIVVQQDLVFSSVAPGGSAQALAQYNFAGSTLTSVFIEWAPSVSATGGVVLISGSANTRTINAGLSLQSALTSSAFTLDTTLTGTTSNVTFNNANRNRAATTSLTGAGSLSPVDVSPFVGAGSILVTNTFQNLLITAINTISGGGGNVSVGSPTLLGSGVLRVTYTGTDIVTNAVPEPGTWLMMIVGFGLVGAGARRANRGGAVRA